MMEKRGLFIGLITLDLIYLAEAPPQNNQKLVATDYTVAAGGPATNAAVTFSYLGNQATVLGVLGSHPMTQLIQSDLNNHQVSIRDLQPSKKEPPPVSSIIVSEATGDRAIISINATQTQIENQSIPTDILQDIDIVLIDGHQMQISHQIAQIAKAQKIPIVIDGGSWKPGFEKILPLANHVICSANFHPPNCETPHQIITYLQQLKIPNIAITNGDKPIKYTSSETPTNQTQTVQIPKTSTIDTLGAGDIFHGAFCHYILQQNFSHALQSAAKIATKSCQHFGTRNWMKLTNQ
jgi:sugar/nucleoside kinase (ribokinase family)